MMKMPAAGFTGPRRNVNIPRKPVFHPGLIWQCDFGFCHCLMEAENLLEERSAFDMGNGAVGYITIRFVNGTEQKFEYRRVEDRHNIGTMLQGLLNANQLLLELQGSLLVIPSQNILSIEITPPPAKLPPNTVKQVRIAS
jgi:hypothetical protein